MKLQKIGVALLIAVGVGMLVVGPKLWLSRKSGNRLPPVIPEAYIIISDDAYIRLERVRAHLENAGDLNGVPFSGQRMCGSSRQTTGATSIIHNAIWTKAPRVESCRIALAIRSKIDTRVHSQTMENLWK